jgi:ferredoxin
MPHVIFRYGASEVVVDYRPDGQTSVLELARRHDIPLPWRCGLGTCGSCVAFVTVLDGAPMPMGRKERNVLDREGKLEPGRRLTCSYLLTGENLRVAW